jgi:hypothetical protein
MSNPRDRDGFEDPGASGWREPEHLGQEGTPDSGPPASDAPASDAPASGTPAPAGPSSDAGAQAWEPPGWSLPSAEPDRARTTGPATPPPAGDRSWAPPSPSDRQPEAPRPDAPRPHTPEPGAPQDDPALGRGARETGAPDWLGRGRGRSDRVGDQVFRYEGDLVGAQAWGVQNGWTPSDGTGPEDAVLADLVAGAPVRPSKDDRPANVLRGRLGSIEMVAFDIVYTSGRYAQPRWAVTAAPVLGDVPGFRLSPARFWKHRIGGLVHLPSGDPEFDQRWVLLAAEDSPQLRRLVDDPVVRQLLLGSDDGDELWSAAGHVAAVRPDGHRPQLIEHQGRILTAVVGALAAVR